MERDASQGGGERGVGGGTGEMISRLGGVSIHIRADAAD